MLLVKRIISEEGKSKVYINGEIASVSILKEIGKYLADFHGQHEQQSLLNQENQRMLLDYFFPQCGIKELCSHISALYKDMEENKAKLAVLNISEQERAQKIDMLEFQIREIESANLKTSEDEKLSEERTVLINAEKLSVLAADSYQLLYGDESHDGGVLAKLSQALNYLKQISATDTNAASFADSCNKVKLELEELIHELRNYKDRLEANPARLEEVESRLDMAARLKKVWNFNRCSY